MKIVIDDEEIKSEGIVIPISKGTSVLTKPSEKISIDVYKENPDKIHRRMRRTSFQARLGKRLDNISRKVIDNQIRLTSHPTDMLRVKAKRDPRSGDLISRTIEDAEVLPIVLPPLKDIPMRRFIREDNQEVIVPSLYPTSETTYYVLYAPMEVNLNEDDLLLRLISDPNSDNPYVLCLQVKEILGDLGYSSFRQQKFWASLYDEPLPKQVIGLLKEAIEKRGILGW